MITAQLEALAGIAEYLDNKKLHHDADVVTSVMVKLAQSLPTTPPVDPAADPNSGTYTPNIGNAWDNTINAVGTWWNNETHNQGGNVTSLYQTLLSTASNINSNSTLQSTVKQQVVWLLNQAAQALARGWNQTQKQSNNRPRMVRVAGVDNISGIQGMLADLQRLTTQTLSSDQAALAAQVNQYINQASQAVAQNATAQQTNITQSDPTTSWYKQNNTSPQQFFQRVQNWMSGVNPKTGVPSPNKPTQAQLIQHLMAAKVPAAVIAEVMQAYGHTWVAPKGYA